MDFRDFFTDFACAVVFAFWLCLGWEAFLLAWPWNIWSQPWANFCVEPVWTVYPVMSELADRSEQLSREHRIHGNALSAEVTNLRETLLLEFSIILVEGGQAFWQSRTSIGMDRPRRTQRRGEIDEGVETSTSFWRGYCSDDSRAGDG